MMDPAASIGICISQVAGTVVAVMLWQQQQQEEEEEEEHQRSHTAEIRTIILHIRNTQFKVYI